MKNYKRLTEKGSKYFIPEDSPNNAIVLLKSNFEEIVLNNMDNDDLCDKLNRLADLEDKIESGEIDYVEKWKRRAKVAEEQKNKLKTKIEKANKIYGVVRLKKTDNEPDEILCTHCGENINYYVTDVCLYCGAKLSANAKKEKKCKYTDILQLKAFCDDENIKCILTERRDNKKKWTKGWDGYKIKFLNGDVIQCKNTNFKLEFFDAGSEIDGEWVSLERAKEFVREHKEWLDMSYHDKQSMQINTKNKY